MKPAKIKREGITMPLWVVVVLSVTVVVMAQAGYGDVVGENFALSTYVLAMASFVALSGAVIGLIVVSIYLFAWAKKDRAKRVIYVLAAFVCLGLAGYVGMQNVIGNPATSFVWPLVAPYVAIASVAGIYRRRAKKLRASAIGSVTRVAKQPDAVGAAPAEVVDVVASRPISVPSPPPPVVQQVFGSR
ncbi:hypothetical protein H7Y40_01340 [Pedobacter sp.]|nr:hypothetical protein [Candidatus Saccharibacteria bacterium]